MKSINKNTQTTNVSIRILLAIIGLLIVNLCLANKPLEENDNEYYPSATINKVTTCHNVYKNGKKGMYIYINFDISNAYYTNCNATAWFSYENGGALKDRNGYYSTTANKVATSTSFCPRYTDATFTSLEMFIPYDELDLCRGYHRLKFQVGIFKGCSQLDLSSYVYFTYRS